MATTMKNDNDNSGRKPLTPTATATIDVNDENRWGTAIAVGRPLFVIVHVLYIFSGRATAHVFYVMSGRTTAVWMCMSG